VIFRFLKSEVDARIDPKSGPNLDDLWDIEK
jgi:hypothetical protein